MADGGSTRTYDLVVIGGGPGGYVAAIRAAQLGMTVALVEKEPALGGTCLRVGCIPSKALLESSELFHQAGASFANHGIQISDLGLDLAKMMKRKDRVVKALTGGVRSLLKKNKIDHVQGIGSITADGNVKVSGGEPTQLNAKNILLATGSEPIEIPPLPFDGTRIVSSTEALSFESVPETLVVVGAGVIGLELGSVWSRLGSDVTVIEMADRILPGMDREMADELQKVLEKQGLTFRLGCQASGAEVTDTGVSVVLGDDQAITAERVLVAVGRRAYTAGLGLDEAGVTLDDRGRIHVDEHYQTDRAGIYAIGDVIAGPMLAHKAEDEGMACVERIAGIPGHVNYDAIPGVVYTWPELASVGLTEEQSAGRDVRIGRFPFMANGRARTADEKDGLVKIIADADTDQVLGVHMLGPRVADMIAEAALLIEFGGSSEDIARTCHPHPTYSEAVREAALDVDGRVIHK